MRLAKRLIVIGPRHVRDVQANTLFGKFLPLIRVDASINDNRYMRAAPICTTSPANSMPRARPAPNGVTQQSAAMSAEGPAFSIIPRMSAASAGTDDSIARTRIQNTGSPAATRKSSGSSTTMIRRCGSSSAHSAPASSSDQKRSESCFPRPPAIASMQPTGRLHAERHPRMCQVGWPLRHHGQGSLRPQSRFCGLIMDNVFCVCLEDLVAGAGFEPAAFRL